MKHDLINFDDINLWMNISNSLFPLNVFQVMCYF